MRYTLVIVALLLTIAAPATAQQTQSPAETAIQINSAVSSWAIQLTQQQKAIEELQKQLAAAQAHVKELEAKKSEPVAPKQQ